LSSKSQSSWSNGLPYDRGAAGRFAAAAHVLRTSAAAESQPRNGLCVDESGRRRAGMPAVDVATLPPYSFRQPCPRCRRRTDVLVMFDRACPEVADDHYHRRCTA
jgi:hypothetical protein